MTMKGPSAGEFVLAQLRQLTPTASELANAAEALVTVLRTHGSPKAGTEEHTKWMATARQQEEIVDAMQTFVDEFNRELPRLRAANLETTRLLESDLS